MVTEQDKTLEALQIAIQMEIDGKEYYLKASRLRTIFTEVVAEVGSNVKAPDIELDAVATAMDLENKTYDFYKSQTENVSYDAERDFYESLAAEERGHHQILLDYYEYLKDPAGWFVKTEHPSLDGG
ncbi:hypothetical protein ES703_21226 [subsurface metagenome]